MNTAAIEFDKVHFSYSQQSVFSGLSFQVDSGCFTALLGPNGAGKSTVFHLLVGLLVPDSGTIRITGVSNSGNSYQTRRKIGVVFQQTTLDLELTVRQNLRYFVWLHGKQLATSRFDELIAQFALEPYVNTRVAQLSGGLIRRVEIVRSLLHDPEILIFDEPTVGLDIPTKTSITNHAHALCAQGISVLWITHLLDEIEPDDRVIILQRGKIKQQGSFTELGGAQAIADSYRQQRRQAL